MAENLNDVLPRLDAVEARLSSLFHEIEYISEVPILRDEYTRLSADLRSIQTGLGFSKTTRLLRNKWPHIFVTYLSITAAYNDNRGYWQAVVDNLGITSIQSIFSGSNHWGKLYLELLARFGLEDFSDADLNFPYVAPIRLQGGIPRYSLPDFFEYYVIPSVEKQDMTDLDDEDAFEEIQTKSSAKYFADNVVKLYMKNGGRAAEDFFSRCRQMARIALKGDPLPAPSRLELRPYVVQLFEDFLANRIEKSSAHRISSPRLTFYPHQPAFGLFFPEQSISDNTAHYQYHWRLRLYVDNQLNKESLHHVRVFRKGMEIISQSADLTLEHPVNKAVVDFGYISRDDGLRKFHSIRSWPLRVLPEPELPQVSAFSDAGKVIRLSDGLRADYCWFLIPRDSTIQVLGEAVRIEEVFAYWRPWDGWKAELWDISSAQLVEISSPTIQKIIYPVIHPIPEPNLVGNYQIPYSRVINDQPLFIGQPPEIELYSDAAGVGWDADGLEDWKIRLTSQGLTEPVADHCLPLSDGLFGICKGDDAIRINLGKILGEKPVGAYQLVLSHKDGKEFELPFRCWPVLVIRGLTPLILPEGEGGKTVTLEFDLPPQTHLDAITDPHRSHRQPTIQAGQQTGELKTFLVEIPPGVTTGAFILSYPQGEKSIHVPVDVCIPRLQWSVNFDQTEGGELEWQDRLLDVPLPRIKQSELTQLYIGAELPQNSRYTLNLSLILPGKNKTLQVLDSNIISDREPRCKFSIKPYLDTISGYPAEPFFDLELQIEGGHLEEAIRLPVMRIARTIDVRNVWLDHEEDGTVSLHWIEPNPLQHRRAQIWSVWQPWLDPTEVRLPDDPPKSTLMENDHWYRHDLSSDGTSFPESCYAVRFIAVPTWVERPIPAVPPPGDVKIIQTGDPQTRLSELEQLLRNGMADPFTLHFEKACIYDDLDDRGGRDQEVSWCSSHANQASVPVLIRFYHWLEGRDPHTQKALRLRMFRPDWLLNLFLQIDEAELRREYLRPLLTVDSIQPASAKIILDHADFPEIASLAVNTLVEDENKYAVQYLLDQIRRGKSSVLGAFEVLKPKADFALFALLDLPESPERDRLLHELSSFAEIPLLVYPGWWIRSDAGWGRIEEIVDPDSGEEKEYYRIDREKPSLTVTLRPGSDDLIIQIDLIENQIVFEDSVLFLCCHHTGCRRYITNDQERLMTVHNCVAHDGLQPCFLPVRSNTYHIRQDLFYRPHPPEIIDG